MRTLDLTHALAVAGATVLLSVLVASGLDGATVHRCHASHEATRRALGALSLATDRNVRELDRALRRLEDHQPKMDRYTVERLDYLDRDFPEWHVKGIEAATPESDPSPVPRTRKARDAGVSRPSLGKFGEL